MCRQYALTALTSLQYHQLNYSTFSVDILHLLKFDMTHQLYEKPTVQNTACDISSSAFYEWKFLSARYAQASTWPVIVFHLLSFECEGRNVWSRRHSCRPTVPMKQSKAIFLVCIIACELPVGKISFNRLYFLMLHLSNEIIHEFFVLGRMFMAWQHEVSTINVEVHWFVFIGENTI